MNQPVTIDDIPDMLAAILGRLDDGIDEVKAERKSRKWQVRTLTAVVVVLVLVVAATANVEWQTAHVRHDSRCGIRASIHATDAATVAFLRRTVRTPEGEAAAANLAAVYAGSEASLAESLPAKC